MQKKEKNLTITQEEIESNHIVKSTKSYLIVFSILFLSILLLLVGSLFRTNITPDYPIVFKGADNRLMVITRNNDVNDITNIEETDIVYANSDVRYILYTDKNTLYLLDTTSTNNKKILTNNANSYGFSSDDKYVYYIENNKDLHLYNRKTASDTLIDTDVTKFLDISLNYAIYEKDNCLIVKDIETGSSDIAAKSYEEIILSKDGKKMLYSNLNTDESLNYYLYNFVDSSNERILTDIEELLSYNANFTKFIYTTKTTDTINIYNNIKDSKASSDKKFVALDKDSVTKEEYEANQKLEAEINLRNEMRDYAKNYTVSAYDVYYQNNQTKTLLASSVNKVYINDITDRKLIYTKMNWNSNFDLASYTSLEEFKKDIETNKENGLYYKVIDTEASLVKENVNETLVVELLSGDGIYFSEDNNLYYSKVTNKKAGAYKLVAENLINPIKDMTSDVGLIYLVKENDTNTLKYISGGKSSIISTNVYPEYITISETENAIYYLKDYENNQGKLMLYNGIINSKIADGVNSFIYINDDLMYATKNFDEKSSTCDLYRLNGSKLTLVYKGVSKWYNPIAKESTNDEKALAN
ncbi:unknown [Mycoplasma sp. CAG:956]|nr:unknown [Mycoplasma sp. CAG:956]